MKVRGVDGCHAGWFAVSLGPNGDLSAEIFDSAALLFEAKGYSVTAIDIPIGLPSRSPRRCDIEARTILGDRKSSVFPAPLRGTLLAKTYEHACKISEQAIHKKLSQQTFALLPKIRDVDEYLRRHPDAIPRVKEVHPEVSFTFWNNRRPMKYSKKSGFGFLERITLVNSRFPGNAERFRGDFSASKVSDDDILDALAALWSAIRIQSSDALCVDPQGAKDEQQLPMNIWA